MSKLCKDCPHFHIACEPEKIGGQLVDWGRAECNKYNLCVDFVSHKKLEALVCAEDDLDRIRNKL